MAELRKIVPRPALSDFRQMVKPGPSIFDALADVAQTAYNWLEPAAVEEMKRSGTAEGIRAAQGGGYTVTQSTSSGTDAAAPAGPNASLGDDAMAALGKPPQRSYIDSLIGTESGGNWRAQNSETGAGGAKGHFGRVQFGKARLQEAMNAGAIPQGTTPEQFMESPDLQMAAENWHFGDLEAKLGDLVGREVNGQTMDMGALVAMGHLGGAGGARKYVESGGAYNPSDAYGTSLSDYARTHGGKGGPVTKSTSGGDPAASPPVMVRTSSGKVEPRLFSPLAGPILQAHNAAAGVAYVSEKMVQGQTDLIGMAGEFALNPQGFQQAAESYIGQMVDDAPEQFRNDLMMEMRGQAQKTFLGIVEDQQRDTRQRAANSSGALVDRWSTDYVDALASGDMTAAGEAEAKLRSVLRSRESLPGLAWTPEQSENVILGARSAAEKAVVAKQKEVESGLKGTLNTIIDAAKAGMTAADEAILGNPTVQAMLPDLWREASAFVTLRDQIPTFNTMTPAAQAAALAEMKSQPVSEEWETDLYGAAEKVAADNAKAWRADPIKRAGEVLTDEPPPPIPELDPNNPEAFMSALGERAVYASRLTEAGYMDRKVYLSKDEAKTLGGLFAKEVPPEMKAMAAGAIVGAMGDDAAGFFRQIKTNDPIIPHVGALMARGGDTTVAVEAMTGQQYLDEKIVPAPSAKAVSAGRAPLEAAMKAVPGMSSAMDGISKTATAIYAARIPANADEETQAQVMEEAWQSALGQNDDLGILRGGIQEVGGQQVLLPPTVAGEDLQGALDRAFGFQTASGIAGWWGTLDRGPQDEAMWMAAAGGIPSLGGEPIDPTLWRDGEITMTPVGGSKYMLSVTRNGVMIDIGVQGQADDVPFIVDAEALIGASLVPK